MEKELQMEKNEGMVKVTLKCGRAFTSETASYSGDGCGGCETNTNNHTQATCC